MKVSMPGWRESTATAPGHHCGPGGPAAPVTRTRPAVRTGIGLRATGSTTVTEVDRVGEIVERAREWVHRDERVLGAFVHGSAARGDVTPLSDVDLIVVAQPGRREEIWAERDQISRTLLGAVVAEAHEVPHQRPFRWQARTADLRKLDLALDEGAIDMWPGLAGDITWLLDRADLQQQRMVWLAGYQPPVYDVAGADDQTWGLLSWLAGALLHGRVLLVYRGITDVLGNRIVPVSGRPGYGLGSADEDATLIERLEDALPHSLRRAELARSLQQTAQFYRDLVADWATRTGAAPPSSPLAPAVLDALTKLVTGNGERIES
jgi:predicted nucleotidyltransferase